jgi:microcystin-dependent protein
VARNLYGATSADFTLTSGGRIVPGATMTIWSERTGGTQITDLLDRDSVAVTTVTSGPEADTGWRDMAFAALFAVIGTAHGTGDNSTTFNVPDLRSRFVVGTGSPAGLTARALAAKGGLERVTLTIPDIPSHDHNTGAGNSGITGYNGGHNHTGTVDPNGNHVHALDDAGSAQVGGPGKRITGAGTINNANTDWAGQHDHTFTTSWNPDHAHYVYLTAQGGGGSHENMPPFYALTYLIRKA